MGLLALHTLFVREHNRRCIELAAANPTWSDTMLFESARRFVIALHQVRFAALCRVCVVDALCRVNLATYHAHNLGTVLPACLPSPSYNAAHVFHVDHSALPVYS